MPQSINLIPQAEKEAQTKERLVKMSTLVTLLVAILVGLVSVGLFYRSLSIKSKIKNHKVDIARYRGDITDLADIEVTARNLDSKYKALTELFVNRPHYSRLFEELIKRVPPTVLINTLSLEKEKTLNVAGEGSDYLSIARFVNTLSEAEFEGSGEGLEGLFIDVTLNSVNLDAQSNNVEYAISIEFDASLLTKK